MKKDVQRRLNVSSGRTTALDIRFDKERNMIKTVVEFFRSFLSLQRTMRARVLRIVPRKAMMLEMIPPARRWFAGIILTGPPVGD